MCRQVVIAFCKNIFASNLITAIDGECLACKGRIKLDAAKDHLGRCSEVEVVCLLCSEKLQRKHQDGHDCPMREIICNYGEKFNKKDEEHHQHLCSFKQIQCPFDCGELVERYLLPSHTLQCPAKVQKCTVKGCGETVRRKDRKKHQDENMSRHYSLLKEENERILWSASKMKWLHVKTGRTGEAGAHRWNIPNCYGDICSPSFEMWGRKWRLFCLRRGGIIKYGLENEEGDRPIHLSVSFIVESSSGGKEVYNIPVLEFKKGQMTEQTKTGSMPKAITVNMALLGPSFTKDS
ncbi:uncharacterized protein [Porites lutea]|uniref:uncharacterized protein n=1 Tax=Porites lutea TaxID=51062 RepID=UPI003CC5EFCF